MAALRHHKFFSLDKPALKPLPSERFDLSEWSRARVNIDYHVTFDSNLYSVPYNLVHEPVEIRSTPTTVELLHKGTRVASHLRSRGRGQTLTNEEHRPKSHRAHWPWAKRHGRLVCDTFESPLFSTSATPRKAAARTDRWSVGASVTDPFIPAPPVALLIR